MQPLFQTTVKELTEQTKLRIEETAKEIEDRRRATFEVAMGCRNFYELESVMRTHSERDLAQKLSQYMDNYEYLKECQNGTVMLNQTEWRHYFKGAPRPELC